MAFDALEGLLANDQPAHQHGVGGKERLRESKMNNLKRQNNVILQRWHFIPL